MSRIREGLWRLADPKISITSAAAALVGTAVAVRDGRFHAGWLSVTLAALFCMEVAKNAWGEIVDFDSGADLAVAREDRTAFSGGKRVMVDGLLTRRQTRDVALWFGLAGVGLGAAIVLRREPAAAWIGLLGLLLGWSYHGPPLKLAYRGLGELDVVLCYGPLIAVSTHLIQAQRLSAAAAWASLPLGLMIAAFLVVNEFPDYRADVAAGKKNLVARLGRRRARLLLPLVYGLAFAVLAAMPWWTDLPAGVWGGFAAAPLAAWACFWTWRRPDDFFRERAVQPAALLAFSTYAGGSAAGIIAG